MKILIISTVRYRYNGISNVINNLYKNETFSREEVSFLFPSDSDSLMIAELENMGFQVYQYPRYEKNIFKYYKFVKKIVREKRIELVHIHGNSHMLITELLASMLGGCKVRICHSHNTTCNNIRIHKLLLPIFNLLCTDRFACGRDAGIWMYGKKDFYIINNGIDTGKFSFSQCNRNLIRKELNIDADKFVIGHVGNLNKQKNQTLLLDIMNALLIKKDCECILVGEGEERIVLEEKCQKLGIENLVHFCGATRNVAAYLSAMDMIIMPSLYEGLPLALIEEQANGLPCIVSNVITREVNKSGNVYFVKNMNDINQWIELIINKSGNIQCRQSVSEDSIKRIVESGYDINTEVLKIYNYYKNRV